MQWLQRSVGLAIVTTATLGAAMLGVALAAGDREEQRRPTEGVLFGIWRVFYDADMPAPSVLLAAVGVALLLAAGVATLEQKFVTTSRRSHDPGRMPLAPRVVMAETRGVFAGPVTITVLIPAHNEEACISETLTSLLSQSLPPTRVVVVADNCTDSTVQLARRAGVEVFETVDNIYKKAGGLNQALREILPGQGDNDCVMIMDADTTLDAGFLEGAAARLSQDRALMAVGGLFYGEEGHGLIGLFQRNEYTRYQRDLRRRRGRVFVLTGTASVFRPRALRAVAAERGKNLPGIPGDVYDTIALTEDNEVTIALKSLGAVIISPGECTVVTEVMPTWQSLYAQRLRWQRGALDNLAAYGLRPQTFRYWMQQLGIGYGAIALGAYLSLITLMVLATSTWVWFPFWIGIGLVFTLERVLTVWRGGWKARLLALSLFPELLYAMFLNVVYLKGVWDITTATQAIWTHVVPAESERRERAVECPQ